MRNISKAFARALSEDKRDYVLRAVITLTDNTVLTITNEDIWQDGFSIEDATSADNVFQVGAAIINQAKLVLNNIYDTFSAYNFSSARVTMYCGLNDLDDGSNEELCMGKYIVDEAAYNGSLITLTCLDYMSMFDKAYDTNLAFPATLYQIVSDACTKCGVTFATNSQNFPHKDYIVTNKPSGESTTFRQVISWVAQIAGCFARCNAGPYAAYAGQLELKWYNTDAIDDEIGRLDGGYFDSDTPYSSGDTADGGSFNPWDTGYVYDAGGFDDLDDLHFITSSYSSDVSTDDVVITGVKVVKKITMEGSSDAYVEYSEGTDGYVVSIENNDLIDGTHGVDVAGWLGDALIGLSFRKASITHPSDPSIEAGDVAFFWDRNSRYYPILISATNFTAGNSQRTVSSAETPAKNSAQRYNEATKNYVEMRKQIENVRSDLAGQIAEASGLYSTEVEQPGGGSLIYYHDKPDLSDSDIVMLFSTTGFTITANYQDSSPTWYGMTVDGQMIASILSATGVNADWINAGAISVKDANDNETFYADTVTGAVRIKAASFQLTDGRTVKRTFTSQPTPPYAVGDLWVQGSAGDIMECVTARETGNYNSSDWALASKYTDDTTANTANNRLEKRYGTCSTSANVSQKTVTLSGFGLYTGAQISVHFSNANTASNPTLNVNSTGDKSIYVRGSAITAKDYWKADAVVDFIYDGTQWVMSGIESQQEIFNRLTASDNGNQQGIYLQNGGVYINASYIQAGTMSADKVVGGTFKVGGNNTYGTIYMYNANDVAVAGINGSGIYIGRSNSGLNPPLVSVTASNGFISRTNDGSQYVQIQYDAIYLRNSSYSPTHIAKISGNGKNLLIWTQGDAYITADNSGSLYVNGYLIAHNGKVRMVETKNHGDRYLYCYETPTPYFGDIGTGHTDENGCAIIDLDEVFEETVNACVEYCVFLQKEGPGDLWVSEKEPTYFAVQGTANLKFSWEVKIVQRDFENIRMEEDQIHSSSRVVEEDVGLSMEDDLKALDEEPLFDKIITEEGQKE